jgi:serine/threonine-protein kinase
MIGKTISHYKITEKLGEGGMGEVYLADDLKLDRKVAIKFLPEHFSKDKDIIERFEREAKAAAALNHPNIVTLFDVIEADDQKCIVMEHVDGDSLRTKIDNGISDINEILNITNQICEGLSEAHKADIVHRDIKPENILIYNDGRVKILDFGLAKLKGVSKLTKETSTLGTIHYMSPEQLQGKDVDHRSDIWSLGVVLYEMLTSEVPYQGSYDQAITYAILNEEPKLLKDIKAKYSFDIGKLLAKEPSHRFQDCREVLKELDNINIADPKKRKPKNLYIVFSVVVIIILIIASVFLIFNQDDDDKSIKSLAVLPFKNLSNDPNQEFFVDGITDVLISELGRIRALHVISQTSVMQYKGGLKSIPTIADELNVDGIVEGTVFSDGNRVRITTQLIQADKDKQLWSDKYEYDLTNIFSLQTEIAKAIAGAVEVQLTDQEEAQLASVRNVDAETYQLYLKGRYHWNERTEEGISKAIEYFKQAVAKDSNYAVAYAGLADCYVVEPAYYMALPNKAYQQARAAALKALEIDNKLAEAYTSLAAVRHNYDRAWSDAEKLYKQAIDLNQNYATAHQWYGELLLNTGRFEEAIIEFDRAYEIDPLSQIKNCWQGTVYYFTRNYDPAVIEFEKAIEIYPKFTFTNLFIGLTYSHLNMHEEAIRSLQKLKTLSENPRSVAYLGFVYTKADQHDKAHQLLNSLLKLSEQELIPYAASMAVLYIGLRDFDQAFLWLEIANEQHDYDLNFIKVDPNLDHIRYDPRFIELLKKMGLEK